VPVALANVRSELLPGLFDVRGSYDMIPRQWDKVFKTHKSSMAVERSTQMAFVALPFLKDEGAATQFDNNSGERFTWAFVHIEVALGYAITRKAIDDLLYKAQFNPTNLKLQEAFAQFKEIQAANVFNLGTTANASQVGDGVAFFSTSHPYDGGTWANTSSTPKSLNESTLLADMTNVRTQFVNERGMRILARARKLVIPAKLSKKETRAVQEMAVRAFQAVDCSGLARVDFLMDPKNGKLYLNEINTMPGFTSISMYPKLWAASGLEYSDLIDRLIQLAMERAAEKKKNRYSRN